MPAKFSHYTVAYFYTACTVRVTIFSTGSKFHRFQILLSYMLLLKFPHSYALLGYCIEGLGTRLAHACTYQCERVPIWRPLGYG